MPKAVEDSVVVITGASSGIGKATAHAFAERGARLILGARRKEALEATVEECTTRGAEALAVPMDVTSETAVYQLARTAELEFGALDVWVNNAGVLSFGRFEETPSDVYRRVIETDLFGYIYGMRAVLPVFREQGYGVIINVSSVASDAPEPYTSAYVGSQYALRGITDSIRMELALDEITDIHICTLKAASIDTPFFQHAANYTGRTAGAMGPVCSAEEVARSVVSLARRPRRETVVGRSGRARNLERSLLPRRYERRRARTFDRKHLRKTEAAPTPGNLFDPKNEHTDVSGGWRSKSTTSAVKRLVKTAAALAIPAVLIALALGSTSRASSGSSA